LWHEEGPSEINELHVPTGAPVELVMISEDVIHSFYVPAFRAKQDVLPGRYTSLWFEAVPPGTYNIFCADYYGADHSPMIVHVLEPAAYAQWLQGGRQGETMASAGARVFQRFGCATCHMVAGPVPAPRLEGLWGREVELESGETVIADHDYIRRAILNPQAE